MLEQDISVKILSDVTVFNKYAKYLENHNRRETWEEIVERNMQMHLDRFPKLRDEIAKTYRDYVYPKLVLPSMRSMQFAGKPIELNNSRLFNCSYVPVSNHKCFSEIMFLLLGGTGVGYSVQRDHIENLPPVRKPLRSRRYVINDSIEGWADAVNVLVKSYMMGKPEPRFIFDDIRPKGSKLVTSGGKAPGPQPLKDCLHNLKKVLNQVPDGGQLTTLQVHDMCCYIADAVLAGGIRRAAMIAFFNIDDESMLTCKFGKWWELNPQRARANNSAVIVRSKITEDVFWELWKKIQANGSGEPGVFFTNNADTLSNPCCEIALKANQFCNLTTINKTNIIDQEDWIGRAKAAAFLGTLQASYTDFHYLRASWQRATERDALLGVSCTGIASGHYKRLDVAAGALAVLAENERVAKLLGINMAARTTAVKPEGCRPWYEMVTTDKGIFTLQEMFKDHEKGATWSDYMGDDIALGTNDKITKTYHNGKAEVFEIKVTGQLSLHSTANHKWYVKDVGFVRTKDLQEGDQLEVKLGIYDNKTSYAFKHFSDFNLRMRTLHNPIKYPTHMNPDIAWLLGYLWGDGSMSINKYRLRFIDQHIYNLEKAQRIINEQFGLIAQIHHCNHKKASTMEIGSVLLFNWLVHNGIYKYFNNQLDLIPICVRSSSKEDILAFIAGFLDADGCIRKDSAQNHKGVVITQKPSLFTKHLQDVAWTVGLCISHSSNTKGTNFQSAKNQKHMILMNVNASTKQDSAEMLMKHSNKLSIIEPDKTLINESITARRAAPGIVTGVESLGVMDTYDIEVENSHAFYAGSVYSHNTASCLLGSSSGIHAWHDYFYIRRMGMKQNEALYQYLLKNHPYLIEADYFKPMEDGHFMVPQKAPEGAIVRGEESPIDLLERVKFYHKNWIRPGHRKGDNTHNVSVTVSIKDDEWDTVGKWMWQNKRFYNGIAVIPFSGIDYKHMPFESIDEEKYNKMYSRLKDVALTKVVEYDDETDLAGEIACAGGQCELT